MKSSGVQINIEKYAFPRWSVGTRIGSWTHPPKPLDSRVKHGNDGGVGMHSHAERGNEKSSRRSRSYILV